MEVPPFEGRNTTIWWRGRQCVTLQTGESISSLAYCRNTEQTPLNINFLAEASRNELVVGESGGPAGLRRASRRQRRKLVLNQDVAIEIDPLNPRVNSLHTKQHLQNFTLRIYVLMPFLDKLNFLFTFLSHPLPLDELPSLCFSFDPIAHRPDHYGQSKETGRGDLVLVQKYRQANANENACGHDHGEYHGAKVLNGVKDEQLSDRGAHREGKEMELNLGMAHDKIEGWPKLPIVN